MNELVERTEFRLLLLKKLGGDFIENPERVLPLPLVSFAICPPPGIPLCGAVRGRCVASSRFRGMLGAAVILLTIDCLRLAMDCRLASFLALDR
jgi:hypothetical protein